MHKKIVSDGGIADKSREQDNLMLRSAIAQILGRMSSFVKERFTYSEADLLEWFSPYAKCFKTADELSEFLNRSFREMLEYLPASPFAFDDVEVESINYGFQQISKNLDSWSLENQLFPIRIASYGVGRDKYDLLETTKLAMNALVKHREMVRYVLLGIDKQGDILERPFDMYRLTLNPFWHSKGRVEYKSIYGDIRDKDRWNVLSKELRPNVVLFRYNWTAGSVEQDDFIQTMGKNIDFGFIVAKQNGMLQRDIRFYVKGQEVPTF